jgi:hypothetical protein
LHSVDGFLVREEDVKNVAKRLGLLWG